MYRLKIPARFGHLKVDVVRSTGANGVVKALSVDCGDAVELTSDEQFIVIVDNRVMAGTESRPRPRKELA